MSPRSRCPVCSSRKTFAFLRRRNAPVHQNLVVQTQTAAVNIPRGDLEFVCCEECGFVFNGAFDPAKLNYSARYDNTQTYSPYFRDYIDALIHRLVCEEGVRNCHIVEIGCGKGEFLKKMVEKDAGNTGQGFDPAYTGPESFLRGRLKFKRRLFALRYVDAPADVIVSRHVIEHVTDPHSLLASIRETLTSSPKPRVFCETPDVEWILRHKVIWDFFYEHCSLFSCNALRTLFESTGFKVTSVQRVFGGQYFWLEATLGDGFTMKKRPGRVPHLAREFGRSEKALRRSWQEKVRLLASMGKIAVWGAGAKGVAFANLVDPRRELITCVVDLSPRKQRNYLPGTGHPIVDYTTLGELGVTTAILMNPNYKEENRALLRNAGLRVKLVQ